MTTAPVIPGNGNGHLALSDPSGNVLDLVEAANRRQDDLRNMGATHLMEVMELRAAYDDKLRAAESSRIDAIRAVDQGNVTRASEVAAAQATALAAQLQVSAEALRAQVEATRITTADTLAAALSPIQNDVAVLREVQFRQQGEKTQSAEQKGVSAETRTTLFSVFGVLFMIAVLVSPHIH
jgi:hypothetical protein